MQTVDSAQGPSTEDPVLGVIIGRLVEIFRPDRIYLFGSAARGDAGPDSDYDLMIVVPDATPSAMRDAGPAYRALWRLRGGGGRGTVGGDAPPSAMRDAGPAYRALWRLGAAVDLLVWTRAEFDDRLHLRASLPSTVQREGKLLYAA